MPRRDSAWAQPPLRFSYPTFGSVPPWLPPGGSGEGRREHWNVSILSLIARSAKASDGHVPCERRPTPRSPPATDVPYQSPGTWAQVLKVVKAFL